MRYPANDNIRLVRRSNAWSRIAAFIVTWILVMLISMAWTMMAH